MKVKFAGNDLNLAGKELKVGDLVPDFTLVNNSLAPVSLKDTKDVRVFIAVPSLDTRVCDLEVVTFNEKISTLPDITVYTVSMDLPFAQARWCANKGIKNVIALSDYKDRTFGHNFGVYIEEVGLLARASFVVDSSNKVTFVEYLPDVSLEPNYDKILDAAQAAK
jgi:thioredoxin-dependent peroxiredoxin